MIEKGFAWTERLILSKTEHIDEISHSDDYGGVPSLIEYIEYKGQDEYKYNTQRRTGFQKIAAFVMTGAHIKGIDLVGGQ